jgi:hypothetical protein
VKGLCSLVLGRILISENSLCSGVKKMAQNGEHLYILPETVIICHKS